MQMEENPVVQELTSVVVAAANATATTKKSSRERRQQEEETRGGALRQKGYLGSLVRNQEGKGQPTEWIDRNDFL